MPDINDAFSVDVGLAVDDVFGIFYSATDPTTGGGEPAPKGSILVEIPASGESRIWRKYDDDNKAWSPIADNPYVTTSNPTANNDGVDTANIDRTFKVGNLWLNSDSKKFFICFVNTTASAVWFEIEADVIGELHPDDEPMGFPNRTDSQISFNDGSRTFTISPTDSSFDVFLMGERYTKESSENVVIDDTEGLWFIYYNSSAVLTASQTVWDIGSTAQVALVYWNATANESLFIAEERHGLVMSWATHKYLHLTRGAWLESGLEIGNYTTGGDGTTDSDAQMSLTDGVLADEDIRISIVNDATPTEPFEQKLSTVLYAPVFYKSGSSPDWRRADATAFPLKEGTSRIQYNKDTGGTWSLEDVPSDGFTAVWICASTCTSEPVFVILGERYHDSLVGAILTNSFAGLDTTNLPFQEIRVLYRLTFETKSSYSNTPKAALRHVLRVAPFNKEETPLEFILGKLSGVYSNFSYFNTSTKEDKLEWTSSSWQVISSQIYDGTAVAAIQAFRIVGSRSSTSGQAEVRLWDLDNSLEIAKIIYTAEEKAIYETSDISNLPVDPAIIEIQVKTTGSKSALHSFKIV